MQTAARSPAWGPPELVRRGGCPGWVPCVGWGHTNILHQWPAWTWAAKAFAWATWPRDKAAERTALSRRRSGNDKGTWRSQ